MPIYIGTVEGAMKVEGSNLSSSPIHVMCKTHNTSEGERSVNFPINPSYLEVIDSFVSHESRPRVLVPSTYKEILRDIVGGQEIYAPLLVLFDHIDFPSNTSLDLECSSGRVCVARSYEGYVLDHLKMFGKDFSSQIL